MQTSQCPDCTGFSKKLCRKIGDPKNTCACLNPYGVRKKNVSTIMWRITINPLKLKIYVHTRMPIATQTTRLTAVYSQWYRHVVGVGAIRVWCANAELHLIPFWFVKAEETDSSHVLTVSNVFLLHNWLDKVNFPLN